MKQRLQEHGSKALPYANVLSVEAVLMAIDERFHLALTRTELALLGPGIAIALRYVWLLMRPIARALYRRLVAKAEGGPPAQPPIA